MQTITHSAEARLVETLGEIKDRPDSWTVALFHLSGLREEYQSDYQVKIAVNLILDLLKALDGGIFVFGDGSIAVLCGGMNPALLNKLIFQLRYLYMDDPLAYGPDGQENSGFCTVYKLANSYQECVEAVTRLMMLSARGGVPVLGKDGHSSIPQSVFSANRLVNIERDLARLDVSSAIRRQPVCAVMPNGTVKRVFDELYININHLRKLLNADVDFFSNKWLFKYLTQILDERVIAMLKANPGRHLATPVSININVEALLSDWFTEFNASLDAAYKVSIVFEIHAVDVFADMSAFMYARDTVQKMGYRVCIDGLTNLSFLHIDREKIKADLMKLQWNADLTSDLKNKEHQQLVKAVETCGANRMILCRCDNFSAVEYGQAMKIALFQGRYLDGLVNPNAKVEN